MLPSPIAFQIMGKPIYWYGILIAIAVFSAIVVCMKRAKQYGFTSDQIVDISLFIVPAAIIGARLYFVLFSLEGYLADPLRILNIRDGGLAVYGGIIACVIVAFIYCRKKKLSFVRLCDLALPTVALGQAIGRWGNFVNQEAYGSLVTNTNFQFFPLSVYIEQTKTWHLATFFYESAACICIFLFLLWYAKRKPAPRDGNIALLYALLYGIARAFIEGSRTDSLYIANFRVSQVLSILLAISCGIVLFLGYRKHHMVASVADPSLVIHRRSQDEHPIEAKQMSEDTDTPSIPDK